MILLEKILLFKKDIKKNCYLKINIDLIIHNKIL